MAGAQSFAGIIQNSRTDAILKQVLDWSVDELSFLANGPGDAESELAPASRAHYATVLELYGFLNLHRLPYFNNATGAQLARWFGVSLDGVEAMRLIGAAARTFLIDNPGLRRALADRAIAWFEAVPAAVNITMEGVRSSRAQARAAETDEVLRQGDLEAAVHRASVARLAQMDELDRAAVALHLIIDSIAYTGWRPAVVAPVDDSDEDPTEEAVVVQAAPAMVLPDGLRPVGERALAYLHAGLHVLLAGAPGTGKTTIAQFVAYAWNQEMRHLPSRVPKSELPVTVVANSAWSPFHTVGGMRPTLDGGFRTVPGVFVDGKRTQTNDWYLRPECLVLDEMNRADLDRCVGDLYPLLSGTVPTVEVPGLPGVARLHNDSRFRVVATVNDATLDDIVFPISEGLARRFQRIDLVGASEEDLRDYLELGTDARSDALRDAIAGLFTAAAERNLVHAERGEDRLPFGAGYFKLAQAWRRGDLILPDPEGDLELLALRVLAESLSTAARIPRFEPLLVALTRE